MNTDTVKTQIDSAKKQIQYFEPLLNSVSPVQNDNRQEIVIEKISNVSHTNNSVLNKSKLNLKNMVDEIFDESPENIQPEQQVIIDNESVNMNLKDVSEKPLTSNMNDSLQTENEDIVTATLNKDDTLQQKQQTKTVNESASMNLEGMADKTSTVNMNESLQEESENMFTVALNEDDALLYNFLLKAGHSSLYVNFMSRLKKL